MKMITRNRGMSKSVVETLGLIRRNKKRVSKSSNLVKISPDFSSSSQEVTGVETKKDANTMYEGKNKPIATVGDEDGCQSAHEADGLDSVSTTPAKWSSSPVKSDNLAIDRMAATQCQASAKLLRQRDWLSPVGSQSFRLCDDILREVMEEISMTGGVLLSRRHFLQTKSLKSEKGYVMHKFKEARLQSLFEKMSAGLDRINEELDKKEALLASCGLVRPGVVKALRKRRLEKRKHSKNRVVERLRPNPRPRRFLDMLNPDSGVGERLSGFPRGEKRIRDRNAKIAAKKLAQAKSQASQILQLKTEVKRGRPRKSSRLLQESTKWRVSKSIIQTRPRRAVNIRNHIDWKFCYGGVKEKMKPQKGGNDAATVRKRHALASNYTSDEGNEEDGEDDDDDKVDNDNGKADIKERQKAIIEEEKAKQESGTTRGEKVDVEAGSLFAKSVVSIPVQEKNASRRSELKRCSRSILFERKRRKNRLRLASAQSRSSSESSNAFDGAAACYRRNNVIDSQPCEAAFLSDERKKRGAFYARSGRAFAAASAVADNVEGQVAKVRASHHRRDLYQRLTLLDRVVLGLACVVVQDGDEIHIKQLRNDDLSILLQRVTETGFNIGGISTKTNATNEQEFNITLIYRPRAEGSIRQARKHNILGVPSSSVTTASNAYCGAQALSPISVAAEGSRIDTTVDTACSDTQSDGESGLKGRNLDFCDSPPPVRPSSTIGINRNGVLSLAARRRGVQSVGGRVVHPMQRMEMRHLSAAAAAAAVTRSSGSVARHAHSRESNVAEEMSDAAEAVSHSRPPYSPSPFVQLLAGGLSFRRHSPRKVIRKVYTGTSTVPKILNRRRLLVPGGVQLSSQQALQLTASSFAPSQTTTKAAPVMTSTTGSGNEESAMLENMLAKIFPRVHSSAAIEPMAADATIESSEKTNLESRGMRKEGTDVECSNAGAGGSPKGCTSELAVAATAADTTLAPPSPVPPPQPLNEEDRHNNPANSMCASQLLRLKRHHDEQPQLSSATASSPVEAVLPVSLPPPLLPAASPSSAQLVHKTQRKLNPAQQHKEVMGLASTADIDDGTDFELNTALIHLPPPTLQATAPSSLLATLPIVAKTNETFRGTVGAPPIAQAIPSQSLPSSAATMTTTTTAYLHQVCCNAPQHPPAMLRGFATAPVSSQVAKPIVTGKRPLIPASVFRASAQCALDTSLEDGYLTGRQIIASAGNVVSTTPAATTAAIMGNKRPVVHKYHTFRKISPKCQTTSSIAAAAGVDTAVIAPGRPTTSSQLLKSLLESGGDSNLSNPHSSQPRMPSATPLLSAPLPQPSPLSLAPLPPQSSSATHANILPGFPSPMLAARFNQSPAHQSRGTWQLGGRAIVIGASITTPSNSAQRLQPPSPPSSVPTRVTSMDSRSNVKSAETISSDMDLRPVRHGTSES